MKKRIALTAFLALCVAIALSIVPMSVFAADTTGTELVGTKLTASHAGQTLSGDYYVEPGTTLTLRGGTGVSGLKVDTNKTLTIYIPADSILYLYGGAASGTTGAGAGVEVNLGSTLKIIGKGKIYAYGGKAANGSNGANGDAATWGDDSNTYIPDSGYGGAGGGGAGAGIGTKGGAGGSATSWRLGFYGGRSTWTDSFKNKNISGPDGYNGNNGSSASECGKIYISADIAYTATGGAAGTSGGSGGSRGASDYESDDHWMRGLAGGSGGGGGGAGKAGANVGTGGGGGGGGGSGGASGYAWSYQFLGGGGGGGGAGAVGGSGGAWGSDSSISGCKEYWLFGGVERVSTSGSSGGTSTGGSGGKGAKVKITDWSESYWEYPYGGYGGKGGDAGSNCSTTTVQKLYDVTIDVDGEVIGTYLASATEFLPESLEIPTRSGYAFDGFYAGDVEYYDATGARTSAQITADTNISAKFTANSYNFNINSSDGSTGGGAGAGGTVSYDDGITLTTPSREGYLFRGWKVSVTNGSISPDAYYTYASADSMARMARAANLESEDFIHINGSAITGGFEKIGQSVTLYNLSSDPGADINIEEIWVEDSFTVTFKNFDGEILGKQSGQYLDTLRSPMLPNTQNEYFTYTFKYWKCNIDNEYYTSEELPFLGAFLEYESTFGDAVYDGVTFTAVYKISEYKKGIKLDGSLENNNLTSDGKLVLNSGDTNVDVITNFKITNNDGVATMLLIPEYDASAFSIKAISVNGELVYGTGATSKTVLNGFDVIVTGDETAGDTLKILLDNLTPDASTSDEIFIQIVYVMNTAIGGEYNFGFVTKHAETTDEITHGDRSEAYGTYDPDINSQTDAYKFNELKITVDSTAIKVVIRATGEITIAPDQTFVYNGQMMSAADVSEMIANVLQFTYNGFAKKENNTLMIKWYDEQGRELTSAPKNVGTYQIGISAAETTYYTPVAEVRATFTITPYKIYVSAGDQSFEYNGGNVVIGGTTAGDALYTKDAEGNLVPVDAFVNSEIIISGVTLNGTYVNAGTYTDVIQGVLQCIGNGSLDNYTVVYENGNLTITKAENDWTILPGDKTVEYSGNIVGIDNVSANFGEVKIEYLVGYESTANGEIVPIWSETPPTNAGTYPVKVTVTGNDNYSDLLCEVNLIITKKVIYGDGFTFGSIDKIYNGQAQVWTTLEYGSDGQIETDEEIWIIASGSNSEFLQYIRFAGLIYPQDCINAGTYTLQALLNISNPNYTFILDDEEVDTWTCDVEVEIQKRKVIVTTDDQEAIYSGYEPTVGQGQGYVTITLEDGTTPDYLALNFFGGYAYTFAGSEFDANATYYVYYKSEDGGYYQAVTLSAEEFENNKALENPVQYYVIAHVEPSEILTLIKASGVNAGEYELSAILETINGNYEIVEINTAVFTINKQLVPVPSLGILIYNGQTQIPAVPEGYEGVYEFVGGGKNVGVYTLTAVLLDKDNYAWENVTSINVASLPTNRNFTVEIEGRTIILGYADIADYTTINFVLSAGMYAGTTIDSTSDDIVLPWYIDQKTIVLVYPDATENYVYGAFVNDIIDALGDPVWKDGVAPFEGDEWTEIHWLNIDYGIYAYPEVGTHSLVISQGMFNTNYNVLIEGGRVEITEKILTEDEVKSEISTVIKHYTGQTLVLDANGDFVITLFDYNHDSPANAQHVFYVTDVDTLNHINANGWMNDDVFDYYIDEETGKIYVRVTVALTDEVKANYKLEGDVESFTFDVEAYIAKAENEWTHDPEVDASDVQNIKTYASALFGNINDVEFFLDQNCTISVSKEDLHAGTTYYAKFTITDNNNYYGLEAIIDFSVDYIIINMPNVRLDSATGDKAGEGNVVSIFYDGQIHTFYVPTSDAYTVTFRSEGEWKNVGIYTVTIALTDSNAMWRDIYTQRELTYRLQINKKTLVITADNEVITFGDAAPQYTVTANGLVDGETIVGLLGNELASYVSCMYTQGDNVGTYPIELLNEIKDALTNYQITLRNGTLTVNRLVFGYDDITSTDGSTFEDLINNGPSFIYDSEGKEVAVETLPDELEITIVYKDAEGNILTDKPTDAGEYTVEVTVNVKDGYNANNYYIPAGSEIQLTIEKAQMTITVNNQEHDYDGNDHSGKIPFGTYTIVVNNGQNLVGGVTLTISGEYINAGTYADKISATHSYNTNNYEVTIIKGDLTVNKVDNSWDFDLEVGDNLEYGQDSVVDGSYFFSNPRFGDSDVTYTFYELINGSWVRFSGVPTNAGEYYVIASVPGTDNYNELVSGRIEFRIRQAIVTLDGIVFEDSAVIYNGEAHSIVVTPNEYSEFFNISYVGNGRINAGTYSVSATFVLVDQRNYVLDGADTLSAELVIDTVKVTITANNDSSMYGEAINTLTYGIAFEGAEGYDSFYANNIGRIVLTTDATSWSNVGDYNILVNYTSNNNYEVTVNNGTYEITKFIDNDIFDITSSDVNYLMDLIYSANALRGETTIEFTFATSAEGPFTGELPKNVGTYYIKATVPETDNYEGAEAIGSFDITKATLSAITGITYNADTATWNAVVTTTDGKQVDCDVTYLVGGNNLTAPIFTATNTGSFSVIAVAADSANYNDSEAVTLVTVYSVSFADKVENHDKQQNLADMTDAAFATQYRFAGQAATRPDMIPTIVGYTFRAWQLDNADYSFADGVYDNVTLYADWTVNRYTLNFYNEVVSGSGIVNGVFVEGTLSAEFLTSYTVTYGSPFNLTGVHIPTKDADAVYTYVFAYWADALRGTEFDSTIYVYDNMDFYAVYASDAREFTITYMVSIDGGAYMQHGVVTLPYGADLVSLGNVTWFVGDTWYTDADRLVSAPDFVPAGDMTLYGAYVFDIGAGDVNADGTIDTDDIVNYRRFVVGGYNIVMVEAGTEWSLVNSDDFDPSKTYYLVRVSDANRDDSGDIRDITTIRMALTGGYGYIIETNGSVTGESVNTVMNTIAGVKDPEELQSAINYPAGDVRIKLTEDITLTSALVLDSGSNVTINLNGHTLTLPDTNNYGVAVKNGTLIIEGEGNVVVPGYYGFATSSVADTGHIVINGGTFVGANAYYLFGCYNGSITINDGDFTALYCILNNYASDDYGNIMSGVATVNGGSFEVTDTDTYYRPFIFLGDVEVAGAADYRVRTAENLAIAFKNGGRVILTGNIVIDEDALAVYMPYYLGMDSMVIPAGKSVELDLNGYTISHEAECTASYAMIYNKGSLTINDSVGTGKISFNDTGVGDPNRDWASYTIHNTGTLVVNGGTIEHLGQQTYNANNAIFSYSGSTTINGGKILAQYSRSVRLWKGSLTVNGGEFDGQIWIHPTAECALTITDGSFMPATYGGDFSSVFVENDRYEVALSITGGTFQTKIGCSNADQLAGAVSGGVFTVSAKENTNATLINDGYEFVSNEDGTYTLVERELQ